MPERYVYLTGEKILVRGVKYALVIDFATGGLHRLNEAASKVLEYSEQAISVEKALRNMDLLPDAADAFLREMLTKELISITTAPQEITQACDLPPVPELNFIWIEVISQCNLRCIHCYAEASTQQTAQPSTGEVIHWIDQAAAMGCKNIQLTGGECTLRADLKELLSHTRQMNYETIEIFTNATLLDESLIQFLADNNIHVAFSLYSYKPDTHDLISGIPGSHQKTMNNLKLLLAHDVKLRGAIIGLKQNENELEATEFFLRELGIAVGPADPVRPCGRGRQTDYWSEKSVQCLVKTGPDFFPEREQYYRSRHWNSCWFGNAAISPQGDVLPCVFARDLKAGNLHDHSLEWIFQNGLQEYWKLSRDKIAICCDCEYRYICRDCRPWAYGYTGDLYAKSPTCAYDPYTGEWGSIESTLKPQ